jgi:N-acetyl-anhydromuramyl-L-alanine amidase AmpD
VSNKTNRTSTNRIIKYIILHHSATDYELNRRDTDGKQIARAICDRSQTKWKEEYPSYKCDYHFLIGHTGKVFRGQPLEQPAWHATNYEVNLHSIGICFLGNFQYMQMPKEQFNSGKELIKELMEKYNIPLRKVLRHKDVISDITHRANSTLCPGKNFPYIPMLDALRDGEPFFDIGEDYPYIKEMKYLKQKGIIKGDDKGYFNPKDYITREEAMLIVYRVTKLFLW